MIHTTVSAATRISESGTREGRTLAICRLFSYRTRSPAIAVGISGNQVFEFMNYLTTAGPTRLMQAGLLLCLVSQGWAQQPQTDLIVIPGATQNPFALGQRLRLLPNDAQPLVFILDFGQIDANRQADPPTRCVCPSIRPGKTVTPPASITSEFSLANC